MPKNCSVEDCATTSVSRGMCQKHYKRTRKYGSPHALRWESAEARFLDKVDKSGTCWAWLGSKTDDGYAIFSDSGSRGVRLAHRWAFAHFNGEIPAALEVDHACRNRGCVNPAHLRLATRKQNMENLPTVAKTESGTRGVTRTSKGRWCARVGHNKRLIHIGVFDTLEEARAAVTAKRLELHTFNIEDRIAA